MGHSYNFNSEAPNHWTPWNSQLLGSQKLLNGDSAAPNEQTQQHATDHCSYLDMLAGQTDPVAQAQQTDMSEIYNFENWLVPELKGKPSQYGNYESEEHGSHLYGATSHPLIWHRGSISSGRRHPWANVLTMTMI